MSTTDAIRRAGRYAEVLPTTKELIKEAITVMGAGTEEASINMSYGLWRILTMPVIYATLVEELQRAWPDKRTPISWMTLEGLPYFVSPLNQCVKNPSPGLSDPSTLRQPS